MCARSTSLLNAVFDTDAGHSMDIAVVMLVLGFSFIFVLWKKISPGKVINIDRLEKTKSTELDRHVVHEKVDYLATENERKLNFALQKALNNKYYIHCQVPLISLVKPIDYRDNSKSWAKRLDFVITDKATKVIAVIELDDSTHLQKNRVRRDAYINASLEGHHPLIRMRTEKFYCPEKVAALLESEVGIKNNLEST